MNNVQGGSYVQVFPCGQLLDTPADILESTPGFLQQIIDSFPNAVCLPLRSKKIYLLAESGNAGGKTEQLENKHEYLGILASLRLSVRLTLTDRSSVNRLKSGSSPVETVSSP